MPLQQARPPASSMTVVSNSAALSKPAVVITVLRRSIPHLIEASVIPTALFYCFLTFVGARAAFVAALTWCYTALVWRLVRQRTVHPLLLLAATGITVRTAVAMWSGSAFVYFAQPIVVSVVTASVFLVSVAIRRPLVRKLAAQFWPLTPDMLEHPAVGRLFRRLTVLWAGVNLTIAATTMTLLLVLPIALFVVVKQFATLGITAAGIVLTVDWSVRLARRENLVASPSPGHPVRLEAAA